MTSEPIRPKVRASIGYLLSCILSLLGNSVAGVILPLILLATTGDALAAGALALICAIPQFVIGLVGGAIIDRLNRRNISVISDLLSATSVALLPIVDMVWGLSFGWFVALGLLGAVGDIPGMTARNALMPSVCAYDGRNMQRFMGLAKSLDSLSVIVGPALAAILMASVGDSKALWFTAAMSFAAALATLTLPRSVGQIEGQKRSNTTDAPTDALNSDGLMTDNPSSADEGKVAPRNSWLRSAKDSLLAGGLILFRSDGLLRASILFSFGLAMVLGSFQGLVLPVHFTEIGEPELLGLVLSALSAGMLVSSLAYSALATRLSKRSWLVFSLIGMSAGLVILGLLPEIGVLLAGALLLGLSAGPLSSLLGFFIMDRIPAEKLGSALGTQNSLMLVVTPVAVFLASAIVEIWGKNVGGIVLAVLWVAFSLWAFISRDMRHID